MLRFRSDLDQIAAYRPGMRSEQVAAAFGIDTIVKLSSNESPYPPFPEVVDAIAGSLGELNRYPDNDATELRMALGAALGVEPEWIMLGVGSNSLLFYTALVMGGPGTSAVYADPSFAMYRISTIVAGSRPVEVPLDVEFRHDLDAMLGAIEDTTTIVYVCNPNNPTGTHVSGEDLAAFVAAVPDDILIVVDEAYAEFVTATDFGSGLSLQATNGNVVVYRTFSKAYGLAGLRLGYAVGPPAVLGYVRRVALPFASSSPALAAGLAALRAEDRLRDRCADNAANREFLLAALDERGIRRAASEANFIYMESAPELFDALQRRGVVVRSFGEGNLRVTIGSATENRRFVAALDDALAELG